MTIETVKRYRLYCNDCGGWLEADKYWDDTWDDKKKMRTAAMNKGWVQFDSKRNALCPDCRVDT